MSRVEVRPSAGPCDVHDWTEAELGQRLSVALRRAGGANVCVDCLARAKRGIQQQYGKIELYVLVTREEWAKIRSLYDRGPPRRESFLEAVAQILGKEVAEKIRTHLCSFHRLLTVSTPPSFEDRFRTEEPPKWL